VKDLEVIYEYVLEKEKRISKIYDDIKQGKEVDIIDKFLETIKLSKTKENRYALAVRIVDLRENEMVEVLKQSGKNEEEITKIKELSFEWVAKFHIKEHVRLLEFIEMNKLLNKFYRELFKGINKIGKIFSSLHLSWVATIIEGSNKELLELFQGDEEKIFKMINDKNLFNKNHLGKRGDRCYSVLVHNEDDSFVLKPYCEVFQKEISEIIKN